MGDIDICDIESLAVVDTMCEDRNVVILVITEINVFHLLERISS